MTSLGELSEARSPPSPMQMVRALCHDRSSSLLAYLIMARQVPDSFRNPSRHLVSAARKCAKGSVGSLMTKVLFLAFRKLRAKRLRLRWSATGPKESEFKQLIKINSKPTRGEKKRASLVWNRSTKFVQLSAHARTALSWLRSDFDSDERDSAQERRTVKRKDPKQRRTLTIVYLPYLEHDFEFQMLRVKSKCLNNPLK